MKATLPLGNTAAKASIFPVGVLVLLSGCGGGGGSGGAANNNPPPVMNQPLGGIWTTTYVVSSGPNTGDTIDAVVVSTDSGTYFSAGKNATNGCESLGTGTGTDVGNQVTVSGHAFVATFGIPPPTSCTFPDGSTSGTTTLNGTIDAGVSITETSGSITTTLGTVYPDTQVPLTLNLSSVYNEASSFSKIAGNYTLNVPNGAPLTVNSDGTFVYPTDSTGCSASGHFGILDATHAVMSVSLIASNCGLLSGNNFTGLAFLDDTVLPARLVAFVYSAANQSGDPAEVYLEFASGSGGGAVACSSEPASPAQQLQNVVTLFATDNNGVILELPAVPAGGTTNPTGGVLVFGIGTEANNGIANGATQLDLSLGFVTGALNGITFQNGYFDSGSNANFFTDSALAVCASPNPGFYCPNTAVVTENATMQGTNNANPVPAQFNVENAISLFASNASATAFNDLGGPNAAPYSLDLGLPFFFGQNIYTGFETATNATPYFAFGGNQTIATAASNVEPVVVDAGPSGLSPAAVNTPFISVTVCLPGTATCQTIDHVEVDTGSIGLRLIASVVSLKLPSLLDSLDRPMAECLQFADGTSWGSVVTADITMPTSGQTAKSVRLQLIGASATGSPPSSCTGTPKNTVDDFGANGIIGVGPFVDDCNSTAECSPGIQSANYYYCTTQ
jgi:Protein of unknown function (DUF3443)